MDVDAVDAYLNMALSDIMKARKAFYTSKKDRKKYLGQWVANYEIGTLRLYLKKDFVFNTRTGDFLIKRCADVNNIHFIR